MSGSTLGDYDVITHFADMFTDYLQSEIDARITAAGVSWSVTIGDIVRGRPERTADTSSIPGQVNVYCTRSGWDPQQFLNLTGPVRREGEFAVEVAVASADLSQIDDMRAIVGSAVEHVLNEYWRIGENSTARLTWLSTTMDHEDLARDGAGIQSPVVPVRVICRTKQRVAQDTQV